MSELLTIRVRYFASLREALERNSEQVTTRARTVGELRRELAARGGEYALALAMTQNVRAALNQIMVEDAELLEPDAELAFFPPVTGG